MIKYWASLIIQHELVHLPTSHEHVHLPTSHELVHQPTSHELAHLLHLTPSRQAAAYSACLSRNTPCLSTFKSIHTGSLTEFRPSAYRHLYAFLSEFFPKFGMSVKVETPYECKSNRMHTCRALGTKVGSSGNCAYAIAASST